MVIWIAGDDRLAANALVNRLNEWMDSRFIETRVFADATAEEHQRPPCGGCGGRFPQRSRLVLRRRPDAGGQPARRRR